MNDTDARMRNLPTVSRGRHSDRLLKLWSTYTLSVAASVAALPPTHQLMSSGVWVRWTRAEQAPPASSWSVWCALLELPFEPLVELVVTLDVSHEWHIPGAVVRDRTPRRRMLQDMMNMATPDQLVILQYGIQRVTPSLIEDTDRPGTIKNRDLRSQSSALEALRLTRWSALLAQLGIARDMPHPSAISAYVTAEQWTAYVSRTTLPALKAVSYICPHLSISFEQAWGVFNTMGTEFAPTTQRERRSHANFEVRFNRGWPEAVLDAFYTPSYRKQRHLAGIERAVTSRHDRTVRRIARIEAALKQAAIDGNMRSIVDLKVQLRAAETYLPVELRAQKDADENAYELEQRAIARAAEVEFHQQRKLIPGGALLEPTIPVFPPPPTAEELDVPLDPSFPVRDVVLPPPPPPPAPPALSAPPAPGVKAEPDSVIRDIVPCDTTYTEENHRVEVEETLPPPPPPPPAPVVVSARYITRDEELIDGNLPPGALDLRGCRLANTLHDLTMVAARAGRPIEDVAREAGFPVELLPVRKKRVSPFAAAAAVPAPVLDAAPPGLSDALNL